MPQQFTSQTGTLGSWTTQAPDDFDYSGDEDGFYPVSRLRQQYIDYLSAKILEYEEQRQMRHYYHGAHWTADQIEILRKRRQPVITFNRMARKVDSVVGLVQRVRQDPKAFPKSPRSANGAEIATQCVRSVLQGNRWKFIDPYCVGQAAIEGISGVEFKLVRGDHDDPDVAMDFVFGDDFFYDPRSFKPDFSDARYMGIAKWLDVEAAVELFPDKEEELRTLMVETGFDLTTHADREYKWIYVNEKRLRLVEHWHRHRSRWYWSFYCSMILLDQGPSPFLDERRMSMPRYEMFSANVDHDGDRYGIQRNLRGPQDELNQRRSKALFMSNVTAQKVQKGAVDNVEVLRQERARPDGVIEYNPGFEAPADVDDNQDLQAQLGLMQDARQEIDSFANVIPQQIAQSIQPDEHSGVAINLLQKAGIAELGSLFRNYADWKQRVYRKTWNVVKRTWNGERFIRVTDNQGLQQFIQINGMEMDQWGTPVIVNAIGELSVEIDIDEGPDVATMMQDTYDILKQDPNIPWQLKLFFMPIPDSMKKQIQGMLQQQGQPPPEQQQATQLQLKGMELGLHRQVADIADKQAQTEERRSRSVTDIARAGHLAHEAHLDSMRFVREGFQQQGEADQTSGAKGAKGVHDGLLPSALPQPLSQMYTPPPPPRVQPGGPGQPPPRQPQAAPVAGMAPIRVPANHPIMQHARQAPDGHTYVPDLRRPGKFMHVGP
jgi:hypothetical protein